MQSWKCSGFLRSEPNEHSEQKQKTVKQLGVLLPESLHKGIVKSNIHTHSCTIDRSKYGKDGQLKVPTEKEGEGGGAIFGRSRLRW